MNTQAALLATSPLTQPLAVSETSGRPNCTRVISAAAKPAEAAASVVLMAISTVAPGWLPVNRMAPAELSPSQPNNASRQPSKTRTALWPGIAFGMPSGEYLPRRGPNIQAIASAVRPPST